jgi:hypothetical protein
LLANNGKEKGDRTMKVTSMLTMMMGLFFLSFMLSPAFAGIEPSPWQPQINQLHSIELNVGAIDKRIGKLPDSNADPAGKAGQLQAMAGKLGELDTRLADTLNLLPPLSITPFSGQDEVRAALDGISSDSGSILDFAIRMGVEPSPWKDAAVAVQNNANAIISRINTYSSCPAGTTDCIEK